jgi:hypothetical protein
MTPKASCGFLQEDRQGYTPSSVRPRLFEILSNLRPTSTPVLSLLSRKRGIEFVAPDSVTGGKRDRLSVRVNDHKCDVGQARIAWRIPISLALMIGRNDSCPCGSGKKYKKCCLDKDAARIAATDSPEVDVYRPAALPMTGGGHVPAIACMRENPEQCLFILTRTTRPLSYRDAIAEADLDIDSSPGSADDGVGPDCLRYLDKLGYRKTPGVPFETLRLSPEYSGDSAGEGIVCAYCGERPAPGFEAHFEAPEDNDSDEECAHHGELRIAIRESVVLFRRIAAIPPSLLGRPAAIVGLTDLILEGFDPEIAILRVLEVAAEEMEQVKADGESEPDEARFVAALHALAHPPEDV